MMVWRTAEDFDGAWAAITVPSGDRGLQAHPPGRGDRGRREHGLRDRLRARDRARQHPAVEGFLNAFVDLPLSLSPVIVGLRARRPVRRQRLVLVVPGERLRRPLRDPVDRPRHDLRHAALRRARGRADAPRDRHRAGAGGADPRRVGLADVLAHHAPVDPVGRHLRRRPHHGPRHRRVRRGRDRVRDHRRRDADGDPAGSRTRTSSRTGTTLPRTASPSCSRQLAILVLVLMIVVQPKESRH